MWLTFLEWSPCIFYICFVVGVFVAAFIADCPEVEYPLIKTKV